jgi:putative hydrolase of the HAD superfamily
MSFEGDFMSKRKIGGITFDLWDCLFIDDSDEPKRKAAGRPTKAVERRQLVHEFLNRQAPISRETVDLAYDVTDVAFRKVWHDQFVTWSVRERLGVLLGGLKRELPESEFAELIRLHEEMELEFRPDPVPGMQDALRELKKTYRLAIISDAIFSPGRALRELLKGEGVLDCFEIFVFSDEAGCSKPNPGVFEAAAKGLGVEMADLVHVGDRPHNDIKGPQGVGARGILLTAAKKRDLDGTTPDAVCDQYVDMAAIVAGLDI